MTTPCKSIYKKHFTPMTTSTSTEHPAEEAPTPAISEAEEGGNARRRGRAKKKVNKWGPVPMTQAHNMFTHFPNCKDCAICNQTKVQRAQCRQSSGHADGLPEPVLFGDSLIADHAIINEDDMSRSQDRAALVVQDRATRWIQAYPAPSKNAEQTGMALQRFMGPGNKPKYIYTDGSHEFEKAAKELGWLHDESSPYRPETNGVAERGVRRVKEGTAAILVQSGFDEHWWDQAMVCYCFLRNIIDLHTISVEKKENSDQASRKGSEDLAVRKDSEGKEVVTTSYKLRFREDFRGPVYPF